MPETPSEDKRHPALLYHEYPRPGKLEVRPTKPLANGSDLARAYSPGVAEACTEIKANPDNAARYTARGNLVAVVSNGTAVLGLGNIGALASKPVMEGKAVLFKKFANIDCFDIEVNEPDPVKLAEIVCALEPTFGAINLEDIKAPDCFIVEKICRERMGIPVFHDDQHGTAIVVGAAATNALRVVGKRFEDIKIVSTGGGAAGIACLNMLLKLGVKRENVWLCDLHGLVYEGREQDMNPQKAAFAQASDKRSLDEVIAGADMFLGLSGPGVLKPEHVAQMTKRPIIFALANPTPEILPDAVRAVAPDALIATGRSDFPNQVNNVLCFPFIFRGALDVGATAINEEMKLACVKAIASLARKEASAEVAAVYSEEQLEFGPEYLIPKAFDPRLIIELPLAVAKAAMDSGVAARPIKDWKAYEEKLSSYTYRTSMVMRPIINRARAEPKRVVYCEGEEEKILRAVQTVVDEQLARPILIGRRNVVDMRIKQLRLRIKTDHDFELIDPESDPRYRDYWNSYHQIMERRGVTPAMARTTLRTNTSVIGSLMVHKGDADAVICGTVGLFRNHMKDVVDILGLTAGVETAAAMNALIIENGTYFFCDTQVNPDPSIAQLSEMTLLAAEEITRFGLKPKVALLSHSNFGTHDTDRAFRMRAAVYDLRQRAPDLEIDGEMHADAALSEKIRKDIMPNATLDGAANLFIFPGIDSANISFNMAKVLCGGISIGPILLGVARPAFVMTPSVTPRGIVNVTALASVSAQVYDSQNSS